MNEGTFIMNKALLALLMVCVLLPACGYTLSRTSTPTGIYGGANKVVVPMFINDTFEPLVEKELTAALTNKLAIDGRWILTDRKNADLVVTGRVTQFELVPLSYDAKERILEYRVRIKTEVKVTDIKTDKVLWKDPGIETFSEYRVTEDVTKSKISRQEAIKKASRDFAEDFIIKALDIF